MPLPTYPVWLNLTGTVYLCPVSPPLPCGKYVFQRVRAGLGNIETDPSRSRQMRRWVIPADPMTAPQLARRSKFRDGVQAWQSFTDAQKAAWADAARSSGLPAYNYFLSYFLKH